MGRSWQLKSWWNEALEFVGIVSLLLLGSVVFILATESWRPDGAMLHEAWGYAVACARIEGAATRYGADLSNMVWKKAPHGSLDDIADHTLANIHYGAFSADTGYVDEWFTHTAHVYAHELLHHLLGPDQGPDHPPIFGACRLMYEQNYNPHVGWRKDTP